MRLILPRNLINPDTDNPETSGNRSIQVPLHIESDQFTDKCSNAPSKLGCQAWLLVIFKLGCQAWLLVIFKLGCQAWLLVIFKLGCQAQLLVIFKLGCQAQLLVIFKLGCQAQLLVIFVFRSQDAAAIRPT